MRHTRRKPYMPAKNAVHLYRLSTPGRPSMEKCKKKKNLNRIFNGAWADSFAFTSDESGLPVCLICGEKETFNSACSLFFLIIIFLRV